MQRDETSGPVHRVRPLEERHPSSERFHEILGMLGALHDKKQSDYGVKGDPFFNIRSSAEWDIEPWIGAMMRSDDKTRRLRKVAAGGTLENEGALDSFADRAVYTIIAMILYEEKSGVKW